MDRSASSLSVSRHTLLALLREELKHESQSKQHKASPVVRSQTTVEKQHPRISVPRRRQSWVNSSLAKIGESFNEDEEELLHSPTGKRTLSVRPTFLRLSEKFNQGSEGEKGPEKEQVAASPSQAHHRPLEQVRKTLSRMKSPNQTVSSPTLSPPDSIMKRKRAPPLSQLRGIGSSGFYGDVEDSISPEPTPRHSVSSLPEAEQHVSQSQANERRVEASKVVVHAEVHELDRVTTPEKKRVRMDTTSPREYPRAPTAHHQSTMDELEPFRVTPDTDELLPGRHFTREEGSEQALNSGIRESVKFLYGNLLGNESQC